MEFKHHLALLNHNKSYLKTKLRFFLKRMRKDPAKLQAEFLASLVSWNSSIWRDYNNTGTPGTTKTTQSIKLPLVFIPVILCY